MSEIEMFSGQNHGEVPMDWDACALGEQLELIRNGLTKTQNKQGDGLPVTRIETISEDRINLNKVGFVEDATPEEMERYRLRPGDILFSHINSEPQLGRSVVFKDSVLLLHGMNLLVLRTKDTLDSQYLDYLFMEYRRRGVFIGISARAVNQSSINQGNMKRLSIPLPSLTEQRAIADVLMTIQRAKEATEEVIAATEELKISVMKYVFTHGAVPIGEAERVSLKETEVGPIPVDWEIRRLGEIVESTKYGISQRGGKSGKYPILRMNNLVNGYVDVSDIQFVDIDSDVFNRFRVKKGDVLFNRTNSFERVGKTSIFTLEGDYVFASYLIRLVADADVMVPRFLSYYLNKQDSQRRLKMLATRGVSQSNISASKLKTGPHKNLWVAEPKKSLL